MTVAYWNLEETTSLFKSNPPSDWVVQAAKTLPLGAKSLDMGCGGGRHTRLLLQMGFHVHSVDKFQSMVDTTLESIDPKYLSHFTYQKGSLVEFEVANSSIDLSVVWGVFHQAKSLEEFITAVQLQHDAIRTGGILLANVFTSNAVDSFKFMGNHLYQSKEGVDTLLLSPTYIQEILEETGFTVVKSSLSDVSLDVGTRSMLKLQLTKN
ncbi:MAG: class I SAM-dependent DNA methyltransferase [Patescibacteria group bacterium]